MHFSIPRWKKRKKSGMLVPNVPFPVDGGFWCGRKNYMSGDTWAFGFTITSEKVVQKIMLRAVLRQTKEGMCLWKNQGCCGSRPRFFFWLLHEKEKERHGCSRGHHLNTLAQMAPGFHSRQSDLASTYYNLPRRNDSANTSFWSFLLVAQLLDTSRHNIISGSCCTLNSNRLSITSPDLFSTDLFLAIFW